MRTKDWFAAQIKEETDKVQEFKKKIQSVNIKEEVSSRNFIKDGVIDDERAKLIQRVHHDIILMLLVFGIGSLITSFFTYARIEGKSMNPTFSSGDHVVVSRKASIEKGDIVLVNVKEAEDGRDIFIKRVIASGGDTISIEDGNVFVNGKEITEEYVSEENKYKEDMEEVQLEDDEYFLMGDNRVVSLDSRKLGAFNKEDVIGEVVFSW